MTKQSERIYWDANAWIAYIRKEMPTAKNGLADRRYEMCRDVLKRASAGETEIATSAFTLAEVCKRRDEPNGPPINLPAFFNQPFVLVIPVDMQVGQRAQNLQLAGVSSLKPADATHIASALVWSVAVFHTFDEKLLKLSNTLTCRNGEQLRIVKPGLDRTPPPLLAAMQP